MFHEIASLYVTASLENVGNVLIHFIAGWFGLLITLKYFFCNTYGKNEWEKYFRNQGCFKVGGHIIEVKLIV